MNNLLCIWWLMEIAHNNPRDESGVIRWWL